MRGTAFDLLVVFLAIVPLHFASSETLPAARPTKCHEQERSALLEFKQSFFHAKIKKCSLWDLGGPSKLESWKLEDGDCCSWKGVECDVGTGYVASLDLSLCCLSGPIDSNASLFRLAHLRSLNLALNDFNNSQIPSATGDLVELTSLNLSHSRFGGQIPSQIQKLTNLSSLDLSWNVELELRNPSMENMVQRFTKLEQLDLSGLNVSAPFPNAVANLSSLTSLALQDCDLRGTFPAAIFELPRLQLLDLGYNPELSGHLPEFHLLSPIKSLFLARTNFSGNIPSSIGNLTKLTFLDFQGSKFLGEIPSSIGNLVQLSHLILSMNQLSGEIPASLINLTNLSNLDLHHNQLTGQIPAEITGLTQLGYLDLSFNRLNGPIPQDISNLENLSILNLQSNNLNGTLRLDVVLKLQNLSMLLLSFNEFSSIIEPDMNSSLPNLFSLGLASSNLSELPIFLSYQSGLEWLDLSQNSIYGPTPSWFLNVSTTRLEFLNLSRNLITSFTAFKWLDLVTLDLRYNDILGLLPLPPKNIEVYLVSNNKLSGEISSEMCLLSSIKILDLSKNELTSIIPPCLGNLSKTLYVLSLHGNDLYGMFPQLENEVCALKMIDVSDNQLQWSLPRGLANCTNMEFLNMGNNQILDKFPSWMGSLSNLKVLILHSNRFHGDIGEPEAHDHFPNLRIVDLSMNNFSGRLPSEYFDIWNAMKVHDAYDAHYYGNSASYSPILIDDFEEEYDYSMTIMNKGVATEYIRILSYLTVIDLSSNNFIGEIPNSVGSLTELHLLNLSNNALTGTIPSSLTNLTELESLDLSSNKLSGLIPPALTQLIFLAFFNVSGNNFSGRIPQANQFATFQNDSYGGNLGLCGVPLTKKCENPVEAPPTPPSGAFTEEDSGTWFEENWEVVLMGFGSGLVIGVVVGLSTTSRIERWFLRLYRGRQRRRMHQIRFA